MERASPSTGGSPAYLKWLIEENIKNNVKPIVIEYCNYGSYEVQKKQIELYFMGTKGQVAHSNSVENILPWIFDKKAL